jgi:hemoglobin
MKDDDDPAASGPTPFETMGGEPAVLGLVQRFYDLMDLEPAYRELRAMHPSHLEGSRDKLFWFLCGWLGGPQHYVERFGHPMLRARHLPFSIGIAERDQWMACMKQAMSEVGVDTAMAERLAAAFFNTADWMRNRGG